MVQHPAAQEYEELAFRLDKLLETIEDLEREMTSIQNALIRSDKAYNNYKKEVFQFLVERKQKRNPDYTLDELQKQYKKCIKALSIKVDKESINYLSKEPVSMLAYYLTETEEK